MVLEYAAVKHFGAGPARHHAGDMGEQRLAADRVDCRVGIAAPCTRTSASAAARMAGSAADQAPQ